MPDFSNDTIVLCKGKPQSDDTVAALRGVRQIKIVWPLYMHIVYKYAGFVPMYGKHWHLS